ncbi:MAG: hypothetical protein ACPL3P_02525 [Anaerolineales bacterium]
MKNILFSWVVFCATMLAAACVNAPTALLADTPIPPTSTVTPTATIVWFPPTPTDTPAPTPVITPTLDLKPKIGALLFEDQFKDGASWMLSQSENSSIALGVNEITLAISLPKTYLFTLRKEPQLDNFYLVITATPNLCLADDEYGVLFRFSPQQEFYRLGLTCDGQIHLDRYLQNRPTMIYPKTYSGAVPPGAPSQSKIEIWTSSNQIVVFVNQQYQFTINESAIKSGSLGLFARTGSHDALTVNFSDLKVYQVK